MASQMNSPPSFLKQVPVQAEVLVQLWLVNVITVTGCENLFQRCTDIIRGLLAQTAPL